LAFLVASSLLNPQLFIVMAGGLGLPLALAHVIGTLLLSLPVGLLACRLKPEALLNASVWTAARSPIPDHRDPRNQVLGVGEGASTSPAARNPGSLVGQALRLTETVGLYFVAGVVLAALLQAFVPARWISSLLGASRWYGVLLAGILGVPFYACGGGAVPVIAGLLAQGMSRGAALAFFLAGPATRLTSLAALGTLLNRRALVVYVAYIVAGAALAGTILNIALGI